MNADTKQGTEAATDADTMAVQAAMTEWREVSEEEYDETKIVFDTIGDEFIGVYLGKREVPNEDGSFWQHRFAVGETRYFVNGNHSLNQAMTGVNKGSLTRVLYASEKDTGAASPMRVYRVFVGKPNRTRKS